MLKRAVALRDVSAGLLSICASARKHSMSFAALQRLVLGETTTEASPGAPNAIPKEVEDFMATKLEYLVEVHMSVDLCLFTMIMILQLYTQAMDNCRFGCVEARYLQACQGLQRLSTQHNVAKYNELACKQLEETARKKGDLILSAGIKLAKIWLFDLSVTASKILAAGLRLAPTEEQIAKAKKSGEKAGVLLAATLADAVTSVLI